MSDSSEKFPVGTKVQAVWSEDGEWYVNHFKYYLTFMYDFPFIFFTLS